MAVSASHRDENTAMGAVGPEVLTFEELVRFMADRIDRRSRVIHGRLSPSLRFTRMLA